MRVVCAGHLNWDIRLRVDRLPAPDSEGRIKDRTESGGGSAANVAVGLSSLGCAPAMLGSVGDDDRGNSARGRLERADVRQYVRTVEDAETTAKYVFTDDDGEVAMLESGGANEAFEADDLPSKALVDADMLHLTGQDPQTAAELAERAVDHDVLVSFDPGRRVDSRDYSTTLRRTDLLFVNRREAAAVDIAVPWRITKLGGDGAVCAGPEGAEISHPGFDIETVRDTTGAGDAFAAGFLAAWFEDTDPERALSVANAAGALAAGTRGVDIDLSWDRINDLRKDQPR
ncbi:PfkB family kinase [Natronomonas pharaonis DSM 2160]|uniref:PfkB family kinase n=1 Tax=Natronomonas pharaonis (strain ATCC 35678 / DSM 2160 / CIP 103997 / JCM 8858 / NBRC 14720 / NCIMB 2260 / Gabara) TaxID=348780 RepID=A0A1U7EX32_NATPD|nr:PfkB family carbohydrate kinase [Natronomonas pharaonis]CAI49683.1 PfkB family kinase [Natronomonas pharaonis DSM 2160]